MTPTEEGTPQAKSANLSDDDDHDDNLRKADSCRGETCRPSRAADREARAQRPKTARQTEIGSRFAWWWPSSSLRSCTTLPAKSEWVANVCCIDLLFFQGNRVHKILSAKRSPQLVPGTLQGGARIQMPTSPRHRVRCDRHEA